MLRKSHIVVLAAFLFVQGALLAASDGTERLEIIRVGLDKKSFNPSEGESVTLGFEISREASVQVKIYDQLGSEINKFDLPDANAGRHSITWDGKSDAGSPAKSDVFLYIIDAKNKDGQSVVYNPAMETGGIEVKSLEYTLDQKTGKIEYVLPKACMIRIRAGLRDGMLANTVFDWSPQTAGRHIFQWDGMDKTGQMKLLNHSDLDIRLTCYTLPDNTVIVEGQKTPAEFGQMNSPASVDSRQTVWAAKGKYLHYQHNPHICHEPEFKVSFPKAIASESNDTPIVSGSVPVRVELDKRDVQHLTNTRFEVVLYIDGVYIYEIEEGSSPFTFNWDTKSFAKGPHIVTVNIIAYDDHIGIVSRKVIVGD